MKAVARTFLLCIALTSSLARAADFDVHLRVKGDSAWADAVIPSPGLAAKARPNSIPLEAVIGLLGTVVMVPAGYVGFQLGNWVSPSQNCDDWGCDYGAPVGGYLGMLFVGFAGLSLGTGVGVAAAGAAYGAPFNLGPAVSGAILGGLLSLPVAYLGALIFGAGALWVAPAVAAIGAVVGSVWMYEANHPFKGAKIAPLVSLVPGGGVAGIAGAF